MMRLVGAAGGAPTRLVSGRFDPSVSGMPAPDVRAGPRRPAAWRHGSMIRTGFTSISRRAISTQDPASGETVSNDRRNPGA